MSETLSVCIAGATGWTGPALVRGVLDAPDLSLRSAVSRSAAGRDLGEALDGDALGVAVFGSVAEALDGVDVLVDYTSATAVKAHVRKVRPQRHNTQSPGSASASAIGRPQHRTCSTKRSPLRCSAQSIG